MTKSHAPRESTVGRSQIAVIAALVALMGSIGGAVYYAAGHSATEHLQVVREDCRSAVDQLRVSQGTIVHQMEAAISRIHERENACGNSLGVCLRTFRELTLELQQSLRGRGGP